MSIPKAHKPPKRIVIVGAGPTGLGCAWRLEELGFHDWLLVEREAYAGGLASSFLDGRGYTWDIGGHVQFSHYKYFDQAMDRLLGGEWLEHERESWVWMRDRFIPYPFQNNLHRLPQGEFKQCLWGLIEARLNTHGDPPKNLREWFLGTFGEGIYRTFLEPYNFKVWAYPPEDLGFGWIGERVANPDLKRAVMNALDAKDDVSWGPNNRFRFPQRGGTGEIWRRMAAMLPRANLRFGAPVEGIDLTARTVRLAGGDIEEYESLVSTMPVTEFVRLSDSRELRPAADQLRYSTTHVFGIGLTGEKPDSLRTKCWMYFPEDRAPFYRATVFSNYAPSNAPEDRWSLMVEVSESGKKPVDRGRLEAEVVEGLKRTQLIQDGNAIDSLWVYAAPHGYPTPSLRRDEALGVLLPALEAQQVYSRGRFGAWKYEVSNQDHSMMQGVEIADRLVAGKPEITVFDPAAVNERGAGR
jgi:protoporphyrinogen oxidase